MNTGLSKWVMLVLLLAAACGRSQLGVRLAAEDGSGGAPDESPRSGGAMPESGGAPTLTGGSEPVCALPCGQCPGDGELVHDGPVLVGSGTSPAPTPPAEVRRMREIRGQLTVRLLPGDEGSVAALGCLERVQGRVNITVANAAVEDLSWLSSLTKVSDAFVVRGSFDGLGPGAEPAAGLRSLKGLENLQAVGHLGIVDLPALESLSGLEQLWVTGLLMVSGNRLLTDLSGLQSLAVVVGRLVVIDNPRLPWCEIQALSVRLGKACDCPTPESNDGRACACRDGCKCTGNDNDAPSCE